MDDNESEPLSPTATSREAAIVKVNQDHDNQDEKEMPQSNLKPVEIVCNFQREAAEAPSLNNQPDQNINQQSSEEQINWTCSDTAKIVYLISFTFGLSAVCGFYAIGQLQSFSISNFWCDEQYTLPEIHRINRLNNRPYGKKYSCLRTNAIVDYDKLFHKDPTIAYESELNLGNISAAGIFYCACFGLLSLILFLIAFLYSCTMVWKLVINCTCKRVHKVRDTKNCKDESINIHKHKKQKSINNGIRKCSKCKCKCTCECEINVCYNLIKVCTSLWNRMCSIRYKYMSIDTTYWVISSIFWEMVEIIVQIFVLLQFGGTTFREVVLKVNTTDENVILAQSPNDVKAFAVIIALNGIVTGFCWLLYALFPNKCWANTFDYSLLLIDKVFDVIYIVFPIYLAGGLKSIAKLQSNGIIKFFSLFLPMIRVTIKLFFRIHSTTRKLKPKKQRQRKDSLPAEFGNVIDAKNMFITHGEEYCSIDDCKTRIGLCFTVLIFLCGFPSMLAYAVVTDLNASEKFCSSYMYKYDPDDHASLVNDSKDTSDDDGNGNAFLELYLYDFGCTTKVYKLFAAYPCNCRFFELTVNETQNENSKICKMYNDGYNISLMISNTFKKWTMLERYWLPNFEAKGCFEYSLLIDDERMFSTQHLQVLLLQKATLLVQNESYLDAMANWKKIVFFEIYNFRLNQVSDDVASKFVENIGKYSKDLIYLDIDVYHPVNKFYDSFCNFKDSLVYLSIVLASIKNWNHECLSKFHKLKYFSVKTNLREIESFNWDVFNLPNIELISLLANSITFSTMTKSAFDYDDKGQLQFLGYNEKTLNKVFLQLNQFCDVYYNYEKHSNYSQLYEFVDLFNACEINCDSSQDEFSCTTDQNGNGYCDFECYSNKCNFDNGDCNQLCNFETCNITNWGDLICDLSCNSTVCNFDGNDCIFDLLGYDESCGSPNDYNYNYNYSYNYNYYNYNSTMANDTIYDYNLISLINKNISCDESMLGNRWCDASCLYTSNQVCAQIERDGDCSACSDNGATHCSDWWQVFLFASNGKDYITQYDLCNTTVKQYMDILQSQCNDANLTCDNAAYNPNYDKNMNGMIGFYEVLVGCAEVFFDIPQIATQLDCSSCLKNRTNYFL